jgi:hypothetical protein
MPHPMNIEHGRLAGIPISLNSHDEVLQNIEPARQ